ncbi:MAG: helix-turn-helix domain-containing protein [Candidatus Thermoplasmatota archaeon]|jgi:DNA-binding transcriptional ArsR family regulator|nr:helix-turn-helix domain-containing protein [Candidatus Thermoplasmatota archaeon]MCL5984175.1 helix-turn-helix domain-containing protein [Candidatus Thermoplasmatota archaeon]
MTAEIPVGFEQGSAEPFTKQKEDEFLSALGDRSSRQILLTLDSSPKPVHDLVRALDLPQSTVYHKLHELQRIGLVAVQSVTITPDGKRVELFRSLLESVKLEMLGGKLNVRVRYRNLTAERLGRMWEAMRREVKR